MNRAVRPDDKAKKRTAELERVCAELYQVLGILADHCDVVEHPDVQRALDNAARGRLIHRDLLPWPKTPLADQDLAPPTTSIRPVPADDDGIDAYSIKQFCQRHGISESFFHNLQRLSKGPRTIKLGMRTLITREAAAEWRRTREAES